MERQTKSFKEDLLNLMEQHRVSNKNSYENPYLLSGILNALEDVYGDALDLDDLWDWANGKWEM